MLAEPEARSNITLASIARHAVIAASVALVAGLFVTRYLGSSTRLVVAALALGLVVAPALSLVVDLTYWRRKLRAWRVAIERQGLDHGPLQARIDDERILWVGPPTGTGVHIGSELPAEVVAAKSGDEAFDVALPATGPDALLRAGLRAANRAELMTLAVSHGLIVADGSVRVPLRFTPSSNVSAGRELERIAALARALNPSASEIPDHPQEIAQGDGNAEVGGRAFAALARAYPDAPQTAQATAALRDHMDPAMRLHAGIALEEQGADLLDDLLEQPMLRADIRARAVRPRVLVMEADEAARRLNALLADRAAPVRAAALSAMAERRLCPPLGSLEAMVRAAPQEMLSPAAELLLAAPAEGADELLLRLVNTFLEAAWARKSPAQLVEAVVAVGRIGGEGAIEPLDKIAARASEAVASGWPETQALADAAARAATSVRSRRKAGGRISLLGTPATDAE